MGPGVNDNGKPGRNSSFPVQLAKDGALQSHKLLQKYRLLWTLMVCFFTPVKCLALVSYPEAETRKNGAWGKAALTCAVPLRGVYGGQLYFM